jgi:hypothetical protein
VARESRENRQHASLRALTDTEYNQSALLSLDHIKGTMLVAKKLQDLIDKHTAEPDGPQKRGNINTVLDYILAHIALLEGVQLSKRPLHSLRDIQTPEQADACGISHKNISLIWKCLISINRSKDTIPIGHESQLADQARTLQRQAEAEKAAEQEAQHTIGALTRRKQRVEAHVKARHTFFPDLAAYSDHIYLGEIYRKVTENEAQIDVRKHLGSSAEKPPQKMAKKPRTADRGSKETELSKQNRMLAEKIRGM